MAENKAWNFLADPLSDLPDEEKETSEKVLDKLWDLVAAGKLEPHDIPKAYSITYERGFVQKLLDTPVEDFPW